MILRPGSDCTSFRRELGPWTLLSMVGTPCASSLMHPRDRQSCDGPGNGAMRRLLYDWIVAKGTSLARV